jgi:sugar phosphate permease
VSIAALEGVRAHEAGVASGLINTSQQIGGALGIAILSTIATSRTQDLIDDAAGAPEAIPGALTEGFQYAFAVGAVMAVIGLIVTLVFLDRDVRPQEVAEPAGEPAG